jgi:hypothetical protein
LLFEKDVLTLSQGVSVCQASFLPGQCPGKAAHKEIKQVERFEARLRRTFFLALFAIYAFLRGAQERINGKQS